MVFGSPFQIEDLVFPGVLQPVFFLVGDLQAVPNEMAGKELFPALLKISIWALDP